VKPTPEHLEDRPDSDRIQDELEATRRELQACRHTMQNHLKLAAKVHESFLPRSVRHPRVNISTAFVPVDGLGGDYCQTVFPSDQECYLTICDVTGHGINAALLASRVSSEVRHLVFQHLRPWQIVSEINAFIWKYFRETDLQLSLFVAHLDLVEGRVTHSGGGHPPQLLVRRDGQRVDKLVSQNMLIGVQQECMSVEPEHGQAIEVGDQLFLFTDGLPETFDANGQMLGDDRLIEFSLGSHCRTASNMADCVVERVREFGDGAQRDDLTLIIAELTS
jgi:serine phosphatase RsbU (regulator of sigma subunit)